MIQDKELTAKLKLNSFNVYNDSPDNLIYKEITLNENSAKHEADSYEIIIISGGKCEIEFDRHKIEASEGIMLFFHYGDLYKIIVTQKPLDYIYIKFSYCFMYPFEENTVTFLNLAYSKRKLYTHLDEAELSEVMSICYRIKERSKIINNFNRIYLITALNWLLLNYTVLESENQYRIDTKRSIENILCCINNKFVSKDFSLKYVADEVGLTPCYVSQLFKKEMGVTFQEYALGCKLAYAYDMLGETKAPISQIAYSAGFNQVPYFSRAFTKKYGYSPQKMREIVNKQKIERMKMNIK